MTTTTMQKMEEKKSVLDIQAEIYKTENIIS